MGKVSGAELLVRVLKNEGVEQVFGLIGYYVSGIFNSCAEEKIKIVDTRHEQGAVHMADGYAQLTGKPGIVVITGGPGLTNSISGILKAYKSFTPMVVICGAFEPKSRDIGGLEDIEILSAVRQYTKWCTTVHDTARIPEYFAMALRHATQGRRGPVVLEIPVNYLREMVNEESVAWPKNLRTDAKIYGDVMKLQEAAKVIENSSKPVMIVGNGVAYAKAEKVLKEFAEYTKIPVFSVNSGRGALPDDHELAMGCGRTLEAGLQLFAYKNADTVIVVGSSLDYSISFGKPPFFNEKQTFIQIDIDPTEIGFGSRGIDIGIIGHSDVVLQQILSELMKRNLLVSDRFNLWFDELKEEKKLLENKIYSNIPTTGGPVHPVMLLQTIQNIMPRDTTFVLDGSNAMMWASLMLKVYESAHILIGPSATYGGMGTGLPLALGAKVATPNSPVVLYTGDGSFGFNIIEVNTAVRLGIPVVIVVHNDSAWGFCRETQKTLYGEETANCGTELGFTRYDKVVESFGGHGELVETAEDIEPAIKRALASNKVSCINVVIDKNEICAGSIQLNAGLKKLHDSIDKGNC